MSNSPTSPAAATGTRVRVSPYVAILLDRIGQASELRTWTDSCSSNILSKDLDQIFQSAVGTTRDIRRILETSFSTAASRKTPEADIATLPDDVQVAYREWGDTKISIQSFSDTIVAFAPLMRQSGNLSVRDVLAMLEAASVGFLASLAGRCLTRGAIEIGYATDAFPGELFGPLLLDVYELEKNVADYPRVVVGSRLRQLLYDARHSTLATPMSLLNREAATHAANLVRQEPDGSYRTRHAI